MFINQYGWFVSINGGSLRIFWVHTDSEM